MRNKAFLYFLIILLYTSFTAGCSLNSNKDSKTTDMKVYTNTESKEDKKENIKAVQTAEKALSETNILFPVKNSNDKWGYIDEKGNLKIDYIYDAAKFFKEGFAVVARDGKYGYLGLDGKYLIEPKYDSCTEFSEGLGHVIVKEGSSFKHGFVNKDGKDFYNESFNNNTGNFHEGLACFEENNKSGYVDTKGDIVIKPQFFCAYDFSEGLAMVINDEYKCGYIDKKGQLVIDYKYEPLDINFVTSGNFSDGLTRIRKNGKFGFINSKGEAVIDPLFDRLLDFSEGLAPACINGKWGYIDKKGKMVISPQFAYCTEFHNGYAFAKPYESSASDSEGYGVIDKSGKFTSPMNIVYDIPGGGYTFNMEWTSPFNNGIARVVLADGNAARYVYIDAAGKVIWEMK